MSNDYNLDDILPPKKDAPENFKTFETSVPEFLKEAAYEPSEVMEQTIQKDWERLVKGLSDYVLAEQLTEYGLRSMGKPVGENYAAYFQETLKDVRKSRKKAEQKLFKMIPRHSQLDACAFFESVEEQCAKETEAKERSLEQYPPAGVEKLERGDVARKGLKKEAGNEWWCLTCGKGTSGQNDPAHENHKVEWLPSTKKEAAEEETCIRCETGYHCGKHACCPKEPKKEAAATWTDPAARGGSHTNNEAARCTCGGRCALPEPKKCTVDVPPNTGYSTGKMVYCMPCHDEGHDAGVRKEATTKWKPGQYLRAKHNGADACVAHVDEVDKIYVIKVNESLYPSYYTYEEATETFDAIDVEETKDSTWSRERGVSKTADDASLERSHGAQMEKTYCDFCNAELTADTANEEMLQHKAGCQLVEDYMNSLKRRR